MCEYTARKMQQKAFHCCTRNKLAGHALKENNNSIFDTAGRMEN